jgi:5S rRNA maturation endonuclease (ribonuclease M5)
VNDVDPREQLDGLEDALARLDARPAGVPVVVEGRRDVEALAALGVRGPVVALNRGLPLAEFCLRLAGTSRAAVVLTDWDRKGGQLCRLLVEALEAVDVRPDLAPRRLLALHARKDVKDVQGLPTLFERLRRITAR